MSRLANLQERGQLPAMIHYPNDPEFIREMTDEQLVKAFEHTSGAADDPEANAFLEEIKRRGLDV
ncbi:hypothetical protein Q5H91_03650 [Sphingomonas sp. KR1UV-12]|uniref:Uncharacterized protein n=1 Tax=Sphingomonas aurea TaxID=3063994 RepID=A0ABT9EH44_9SPHN|nr:hypothetical protein [Sphingomonas sp. KR1UV-12]MDP1026295.1 hypothetical protein [Sphingomonas sp. KR1UV-12]